MRAEWLDHHPGAVIPVRRRPPVVEFSSGLTIYSSEKSAVCKGETLPAESLARTSSR